MLLGSEGEVRLLPPFSRLDTPVSCHGDMLLYYRREDGILFVPREYYEENKALFHGVRVEAVEEQFCPKYPRDVYLDALRVGENLICKEKFTAQKIKKGMHIIGVKQGYARCSVCLLGEKGAITADEGLKTALEGVGVNVLLTKAGDIDLDGYSYGFIGGACVVIDKKVIFFGDPICHPDGERILEFIKECGFEARYLRDERLTDYGSAVLVEV